jgi:coenzyme A diphosphatase NUDT7
MLKHMVASLKGRKVNIIGHEVCSKSAVLLPLVVYQGQVSVLFERRSQRLKHQPGEICFPGGSIEPSDSSAAQAAVRETCEELGITPDDIELIAPLDLLVSPFNQIIYPYLSEIKDYTKIHPNSNEVESVFCVPVDHLRLSYFSYHQVDVIPKLSKDFPYGLIPGGENYNWKNGFYPVYFYIYKKWVIWGLTARILNHFLALIAGDS